MPITRIVGIQNPSKPAIAVIGNPSTARNKMPPRNSNTMRVAGGDARGLRLQGAVVAGVRPTTERVRAAIFNILESDQVVGRRAVDLFAGTGSLGIEALSRGAAWADFVEQNARQCRPLQDNLNHTGFAGASKVHCADARRYLARQQEPFDLALLDPPYRMLDLAPVLQALAAPGVLAVDATVVLGHSSRLAAPQNIHHLRQYDRRRYGDNGVAFYRYDPDWPATNLNNETEQRN